MYGYSMQLFVAHNYKCSSLTLEQVFTGFGQQHCNGIIKGINIFAPPKIVSYSNSDTPWCHPPRPKHITTNIKKQQTLKEASEVVSFASNLPFRL